MKKSIAMLCLIAIVLWSINGSVLAEDVPPTDAGATPEVNIEDARQALATIDGVCAAAVLVRIGNEQPRGLNRMEQREVERATFIVVGALNELEQLRKKVKETTDGKEVKAENETTDGK